MILVFGFLLISRGCVGFGVLKIAGGAVENIFVHVGGLWDCHVGSGWWVMCVCEHVYARARGADHVRLIHVRLGGHVRPNLPEAAAV